MAFIVGGAVREEWVRATEVAAGRRWQRRRAGGAATRCSGLFVQVTQREWCAQRCGCNGVSRAEMRRLREDCAR